MDQKVIIDGLASGGWSFRFHGAGFIQVYHPEQSHRYHIWHPAVSPIVTGDTGAIHNHRFGFRSEILHGTLLNELYWFAPDEMLGGDYSHPVSPKGESGFPDLPVIRGHREFVGCQYLAKGSRYNYPMDWQLYHQTSADGLVITRMHKVRQYKVDDPRAWPRALTLAEDQRPDDAYPEIPPYEDSFLLKVIRDSCNHAFG